MNAPLRLVVLALPAMLFQGCLAIVLDQTHVRGEIPMAMPAVVPDSVRSGSLHGTLAIELADSSARSRGEDYEQSWSRSWGSAGGQLQWVVGPHLRLVGGAQANAIGASWWGGSVISVRDRVMRWDVELLAGSSRLEYDVRGRVTGGTSSDGSRDRNDTLVSQGSGRRLWGQTALRGRAHRSGPWLEWRLVPGVWITTLKDTATSGSRADDEPVVQTVSSLGGGWIQEFRNGSMILAGVRSTRMEGATTLSMVVAVQKPIF